MVNIPNLTEPITKLIEVIAAGCGTWYQPHQMRRLADAEAYKITTLAEANRESQRIQTQVKDATEEDTTEKPVADRALIRRNYQETKKQVNLDYIARHAAQDLRGEQSISPEPVDEDWISRFFDIAENITSQNMQRLWGKVLAGEVKRPGSYSLRTLDLLKNISRQDAELLTKAAQFAFHYGNTAYLLQPPNPPQTNYGLTFGETLALRELDLVSEPIALHFSAGSEETSVAFIYDKKTIIATKAAGSPTQQFQVVTFTRIGQELLPLIQIEPNVAYLQQIGSLLKAEGTTVKIGDFVERQGDIVYSRNLQEV